MDCLQGNDLEAAIIDSGDDGIPWPQVIDWLQQVANA